ncbi:hypothetical protein FHT44_005091 [Mycolicibacterium sp. BK634]|uniref:hypothetical protein n=1 Tax=Mycolicibacterium sp. BK634 TaxID=2587099 RepID=UPI00161E7271|nr:hypothetical protein [Mycolicibacterium sp. BK634]MBB3752579.1 hypothetical protein [Mycolicibacterium sp. BK634]
MSVTINRKRKLERWFGKCPVAGCKTRRVVDSPYIEYGWKSVSIFYGGHNGAELVAAGMWCADHQRHLTWNQLQGRVNPDKECNGVCMGAVGPSCDCACGGENHGTNHVGIA